MYLAIDPGIDTGWASFAKNGSLLACSVGSPPSCSGMVVIEKPQIYPSRLSKGNPNDLITLALQVGRYIERLEAQGATVTLALPHEWKGTIPKDIHHKRIVGYLTDAERQVIKTYGAGVAAGKVHNMLDAVGLGKWAFKVGRFK